MLAHRSVPWLAAVLAVVLLLPALWTGFQLDDYFHRMRLLGYGEPAINLFIFFDGDPAKIATAMDQGWVPWWTAPDLRHASLRYLSVLTMQLDYLLWPNSPFLMHLHSLLWLGALVVAAALLYRRILGPTWVAGLAALLYAVDEAHAAPAAYIANRNALIATCFGVLCLLCFARARQEGWRPGLALSAIFLALGLAAGEMALATAAYLAAYAVFLDPAPLRRRLIALIPNGLVLAAWAAIYKLGQFGAQGSGFYLDPAREPVAFARALADRALYLLVGQWTPIAADLGSILPSGSVAALRFRLVAVVILALLALLLLPLLRRDRVARFWCAGALVSILPIAATGPQNRLLFFVGLGSMALLAQIAQSLDLRADPQRSPLGRLAAFSFAGLLLFFHLVLAPLITPWNARGEARIGQRMMTAIESVPDDPAIAAQDLVIVNPPEHIYLVTSIPVIKPVQGLPFPRHLRALANGKSAMRAIRIDEKTLDLELASGLFPDPFSHYFRGLASRSLLAIGSSSPASAPRCWRLTPAATDRGPLPLRSPARGSVVAMGELAGRGYAPWTPPAIGASELLPATGDPLF